ncbi:MAG: S-layer homology domain-containing protein [Syntrophomonadaceae bacterium]|nr:S-layer homology domain-containing protein [Syntrophomonadaceae bacterium]
MKRTVFLLVALFLFVFQITQAAQAQEGLSRGEFAAMLVEASGMGSDLPPADLLVQEGILKGYPDGNLYLERGVTRVEAAALAARTLGITEGLGCPFEGDAALDEEHWGYTFCSWLSRFGIFEGEPDEMLTEEEGRAFLNRVFSTDPDVTLISDKVQENTKAVKTMRAVVDGNMTIIPRPGVEGTEDLQQMDLYMRSVQEWVLPDNMHQSTTIVTDIPGLGRQELSTDMYMVNGRVYQEIPVNIETGETEWIRYPDGLFDLEQFMNVEEATEVIPEGLEDCFNSKLLGTREGEEKVYEIASYGRVDDFSKFMEALAGQFDSSMQMSQLFEQGIAMIDSMSFWSIQYIGVDDFLTKSAEMFFVVNFAEEFAGVTNPLKALQMRMTVAEYSYNGDLAIELPEEALDAPLLEIPELPAASEQFEQ